MVDNSTILSQLSLFAKLSELHGQNPFKIRAYSSAAFNLKKIKEPYASLTDEELLSVPGVGKGVVESIREISTEDHWFDLDELLKITPSGVVDMLRIKGLGPKKVKTIWSDLKIETTGELLDACRQNRLVEVKGFGLKTQADIARYIEFAMSAEGKWHFARVWQPATDFKENLKLAFPDDRVEFTGSFRRACEVIENVEIITDVDIDELIAFCDDQKMPTDAVDGEIYSKLLGVYPLIIYATNTEEFNQFWFESTSSPAHLKKLSYSRLESFQGEEAFYESRGYPYIIPELREGRNELDTDFKKEGIIEYWQLQGVLHNHTTASDGLSSLREMAEYAKDQKYQYLGICDHSQSAAYAGGLKAEELIKQGEEIDALNRELAPFKIFKGVESDILSNGDLDYSEEILKTLDFVVASVHSGLKMDEQKANQRLIKAIENPYTTILGHPTGRLLLLREGYPMDHKYIIDACAANNVVIELNAHPYRLDLDWRWIPYAQEKGVMISINPDAHEKQGYHDMYFGTLAARKGGLLQKNTLNAMSLEEFESFLSKSRS
jgi:DNA polymerase (family 10)